ncbi:hypothetical protein BCR42DRAFT_423527 [Absidia repens]|uniref:Uncharacterized protein n=1 Tax=Absidia repens TaxID=90262 RepID=A0A1X2I565_9FUNG|nr:hypothetical protein BCR42DRAFT_423527 [Absidia repens]
MSKKVHALTTATLTSIFSKPTRLYSHNDCFNIKAFPWKSIPQGLDPVNDYRASFIAGKKALGKLAVYRNKAERRVKASISTIFPNDALKGHDYIVFLKPAAVSTKWSDLEAQVHQAASKIQSLNTKRTSPRRPTQ